MSSIRIEKAGSIRTWLRPTGRYLAAVLGAAMLFVVPGCGEGDSPVPGAEDAEEIEQKGDEWDTANNPARIDGTFVYEVDQLPVEGTPKLKITPSDYWASYHDNINRRWDGEDSLSPAEKFAKLVGADVEKFTESISLERGVLSNDKECDTDEQCDKDYGEVCARRRGWTMEQKGRCIGTWWGSCPGWAAWSIQDPAPIVPVTRTAPDGTPITFYPADIEALQTYLWDVNTDSKFLSRRCNTKDVPVDLTGRQIPGECRDLNPGSFHVLATNLLGLRGVSFVYDRTANYEVWNQPVVGYRITNATPEGKVPELTVQQAIQMLQLDYAATAVVQDVEVTKEGTPVTGTIEVAANTKTRIRLTGDGDVDLYVRVGEAPTDTEYDCRPYQGGSNEECVIERPEAVTVHYLLKPYAEKSKVTLATLVPNGNATNYTFNPNAKRFFEVKMDFQWVREAQPRRESNIEEQGVYTVTDHYHYILETDENGRILGGEWLGDSRTNHPDFLWYPTGKPYRAKGNGYLTYQKVRELVDAAQPQVVQPTESVLLDKAKAYAGKSAYATIGVPPNGKLEVIMNGDGDSDLYVRLGVRPTVSRFDCKSATPGTSVETCTITAGPAGGTYYVRARSNKVSTVTVTARVTPGQM